MAYFPPNWLVFPNTYHELTAIVSHRVVRYWYNPETASDRLTFGTWLIFLLTLFPGMITVQGILFM